MTRKKETVKRAYLARDDRRIALLDVAATVVETQGWQALSMISVAETAQVSRQLVYQHFTSVDELMADTMSHLFRGRYEEIRQSIEQNSNDLMELIRVVDQQTFDDHPGRVRALWQMITATYSDNAETSRMGRRLRHLLTKLWAPMLAKRLDFNTDQSRAMAWMLTMAFWGAHQLVHDKEISRKTASELFSWMVVRVLGPEVREAAATQAASASRVRADTASKPKISASLRTPSAASRRTQKATPSKSA